MRKMVSFIDLDELIVLCRDDSVRQFIQEAVACYRAGAYRSCIVATWNAVVFDFLYKLRELEMLGDAKAKTILDEFEKLRKSQDVRGLWDFERQIAQRAREEFELISIIEESDISRLFDDRSRCAHPSMISLEEPFEAPPELARYHLRSAVTHLLQRPPVQGRSAKNRVFNDIRSVYFPTEPEAAIAYLKSGPLARARHNLIQDVVVGLTKSYLIGDLPDRENQRVLAALIAVSRLYPETTLSILDSRLSDLIIERVPDERWPRVIAYLLQIKTWTSLSDSCQLKAKNYIQSLELVSGVNPQISSVSLGLLEEAFGIEFLHNDVKNVARKSIKNINLLFSLWVKCNAGPFRDQVVAGMVKEVAQKFSLDQMTELFRDSGLRNDLGFQCAIQEVTDNSTIAELAKATIETEFDKFRQIAEERFHAKLPSSDILELLSTLSRLQPNDNPAAEKIRDNLRTSAIDRIQKLSFADLYSELHSVSRIVHYSANEPEISKALENSLRKFTLELIDKLQNSSSYDAAGNNANLLCLVTDHLTENDWIAVFEAFCATSQNYDSRTCISACVNMLERSVNTRGKVEDYWIEFRDKLNTMKIAPKLVAAIDSQIVSV